jgi:hypothetical protein
MYPGSHSDVGGGYRPGALGISPLPELSMSLITGLNMYKAARLAGVPLLDWTQIDQAVRDSLTPNEKTLASFNAYVKDAAISNGPVESVHRQHMAHYFSYRFKHRDNFTNVGPFSTASSKINGDDKYSDQTALQKTQAALIDRLKMNMVKPEVTNWDPKTVAKDHQAMKKKMNLTPSYPDKVAYEIAERINVAALTPAIEKFCGEYIHDSMAGFINFGVNEYSTNSLGLAKFRTVFKGND